MKPGKIIGVVVGGMLIFLAVGAYFSNEPASKTDNGRIAILFAAIMGLFMVIGNLSSTTKQEPLRQTQVPEPAPVKASLCTACGRQVSSEYLVCPYCSNQLRAKCPSCGKDVAGDFVVCPYCATSLKKTQIT